MRATLRHRPHWKQSRRDFEQHRWRYSGRHAADRRDAGLELACCARELGRIDVSCRCPGEKQNELRRNAETHLPRSTRFEHAHACTPQDVINDNRENISSGK